MLILLQLIYHRMEKTVLDFIAHAAASSLVDEHFMWVYGGNLLLSLLFT